jgi:uncharacterized membrane protein YjgN (DUF898 family)
VLVFGVVDGTSMVAIDTATLLPSHPRSASTRPGMQGITGMDEDAATGAPGDAFAFTGTWRDYLPIALTNLALTIVTLGIYRFWAKARERRYLWSHTRFIDDRLEWAGTGREMFIGFLIALALFTPPLLVIRFGAQAMVLRGQTGAAGLLSVLLYVGTLFLFGVARFRALRYRLARSYWHGIRGGSDDPGLRYGVSAAWKPVVGFFALGMLIPWSMIQLWNERWGAMSFGPYRFASNATSGPLLPRWLLLVFSPVIVAGGLGFAVAMFGSGLGVGGADTFVAALLIGLGVGGGFFVLIGVIGIGYYAAYLREAIGHLSLGGLDFRFTARSKDWLLLFLGDVALVIFTLGIGICFLGYRHWSFLIRHLGAVGEVDLTEVTQSATRAPREAEGFADAFDLGAI